MRAGIALSARPPPTSRGRCSRTGPTAGVPVWGGVVAVGMRPGPGIGDPAGEGKREVEGQAP